MPRDLTARQTSLVFDPERPSVDWYGSERAAAVQREAAAIVQRAGRRVRLRELLRDRRWHSTAELVAIAGSGVSSRLHEIRAGSDGLPAWDIEVKRAPGAVGDGGWLYRLAGEFIPGRNLDGEP